MFNYLITLILHKGFWDPDGVYFNRHGYDIHGGKYDEEGTYIPGKGWDYQNNCYFDEYDDGDDIDEYEDNDVGVDDDYGYGNINMDDIEDEEQYLKVADDVEKMKVDKNEAKELGIKIDNEDNKEVKKEDKKEVKKEVKKEEQKTNKEEPKKKSKLAQLLG